MCKHNVEGKENKRKVLALLNCSYSTTCMHVWATYWGRGSLSTRGSHIWVLYWTNGIFYSCSVFRFVLLIPCGTYEMYAIILPASSLTLPCQLTGGTSCPTMICPNTAVNYTCNVGSYAGSTVWNVPSVGMCSGTTLTLVQAPLAQVNLVSVVNFQVPHVDPSQ